MNFTSQLRSALVLVVAFTVLLGLVYPAAVTGIAQLVFPWQANGSLIVRDGRVVGSALIGQEFSDPKYFWGRPSATSPFPYNAGASVGSNLGPLNPKLQETTSQRLHALTAGDPGAAARVRAGVPADLVTASGSGLDPDISPAAAAYQVPRVARARGLSEQQVRALVARYTRGRQGGILGEPRVNVLELNLALDELAARGGAR